MASRPIFSPCSSGDSLVVTEFIEFKWFPGMAESQKQKSIQSLHQAARDQANIKDCLEISSNFDFQRHFAEYRILLWEVLPAKKKSTWKKTRVMKKYFST